MNIKELRNKILEDAHLYESSDMAREYWKSLGFDWQKFPRTHFYHLFDFIEKEIHVLCADKTYRMVPRLRLNEKINMKNGRVEISCSGSYFKNREAISFEGEFVGFCRELNGCNKIPFVTGFIKWTDWLQGVES